jgi:hypothetical protein
MTSPSSAPVSPDADEVDWPLDWGEGFLPATTRLTCRASSALLG